MASKLSASKLSTGSSKRIKVIATLLVFGALILQGWSAVGTLPNSLQALFAITQVILVIHAVEGLITAFLIFQYRQRNTELATEQTSSMLLQHLPASTPLAVLKAGLYAFFVGTIGLVEVIKETKEQTA